MIEAGNALMHHHVRARPGPKTLAEHEDLGPLLLRHGPQPLLHAPEQLPELGPSERDSLHFQEGWRLAVLDADCGDVSAGQDLAVSIIVRVDPNRSRSGETRRR